MKLKRPLERSRFNPRGFKDALGKIPLKTVAQMAGVPLRTLYAIQNGTGYNPGIESLDRIAQCFSSTVDELFINKQLQAEKEQSAANGATTHEVAPD